MIAISPIEQLDQASDGIFFINLNTQGFRKRTLGVSVLTQPFT